VSECDCCSNVILLQSLPLKMHSKEDYLVYFYLDFICYNYSLAYNTLSLALLSYSILSYSTLSYSTLLYSILRVIITLAI
jgi:hypothetical protein